MHVAGGREHDGLYHDTHTDPTPSEVLDLVTALCPRRSAPGPLLGRDGNYPPRADLYAQLDAIAEHAVIERVAWGLEVDDELHVPVAHRREDLVEIRRLARPRLDATEMGVDVDDGGRGAGNRRR